MGRGSWSRGRDVFRLDGSGWHRVRSRARLDAVNAWQRLSLAALALGLMVACSSSATPGPVSPGGGATGGGAVDGTPSAGGGGGDAGSAAPPVASKPGKPLLDPAGQACVQPSCAYHAGVGGYFFCLAGGAGSCFHFGSPCEPPEACMFEAASRTFKRCAEVVEGKCQRFGAACEPRGTCWYRAEDRLYRECLDRKPGACARWGDLCAPAV